MTQDWAATADKALANGDYGLAKEAYTHAIEQAEAVADCKRYTLYANRSEAKYRMQDYSSALEDAERSVYLKPSYGIGHLRVGKALEALKQYQNACEAYKLGLIHDAASQNLLQARNKISQLIERMETEKEAPEHESLSPNLKTFLRWLKEKGAKFPKVAISEYGDEYRGVVAKNTIQGDEIVISVPRSLMITSENAIQSSIGHAIIQSGVEVKSRHSFLAAFLLQERSRPENDPSPWAPYLDVLPEKFENIPLNFSREELSYLKGSMAIDKIETRIELLKSEYKRIANSVPAFAQFSYEEFAWARCVVITRIFGVTVDGRKTEALVPLADFLNHKRPRETVWLYEPVSSCFNITSLGTISNGMQITDSYGRKCNSRFFTNYGFSIEDNDDNEAIMRFALDPSDPLLHRKALFLREDGPTTEKIFSIPASVGKDAAVSEVMAFLRLAAANHSEFDQICEATIPNLKRIQPINCRNEQAALYLLKSGCLSALSDFETTLENDHLLLDDCTLTPNVRNCIVMRMGEKKVLNFFIEFVDDMVPLLSLPKIDINWVLSRCQERHFSGAFDIYIDSVIVPIVKNDPS